MCSNKKLQLAKEDKAFVFRKKSFYISTGITLLVIFVAIIFAFADVKLQAQTNCANIQKNIEQIKVNTKSSKAIEEIRFNLKNLCVKQGVKYIEGADK